MTEDLSGCCGSVKMLTSVVAGSVENDPEAVQERYSELSVLNVLRPFLVERTLEVIV